MKILAAYYKLDRAGTRLGRERCQEHIPVEDGFTGTVRALCGRTMDTDTYAWKVIDGQPKYLCAACKRMHDPAGADRAALTAWVNGEPIR